MPTHTLPGYDTWRYPSMPRAIRERKTEPPGAHALQICWCAACRVSAAAPRAHAAAARTHLNGPCLSAARLTHHAVGRARAHAASGAAPAPPRQAAPPPGASAYAHRQGQLSLRVPAGTQGLKLQLREHEGFVLGTAFSPDTVTGDAGRGTGCADVCRVGAWLCCCVGARARTSPRSHDLAASTASRLQAHPQHRPRTRITHCASPLTCTHTHTQA
jgi:hypothetical protein